MASGTIFKLGRYLFPQGNPEIDKKVGISLSKTMGLGIPCSLINSLKYSPVMSVASLVLLQAVKRAIF